MNKLALALLVIPGLALAQVAPAQQREVLVLTSSTLVTPNPRVPNIVGYEIQNLGPNTIHCNLGNAAVANKARRILSGNAWSFGTGSYLLIYCIADTAAQVTGAATIVSSVKKP